MGHSFETMGRCCCGSILRGLFYVVDDEGVDGALAALETEAEAMHSVEDCGFLVCILRVAGWEIEVVVARETGLVKHRNIKEAAELSGEVGHGDVVTEGLAVPNAVFAYEVAAPVHVRVLGWVEKKLAVSAAKYVGGSFAGFHVVFEGKIVV
jgi:hypothetical protein